MPLGERKMFSFPSMLKLAVYIFSPLDGVSYVFFGFAVYQNYPLGGVFILFLAISLGRVVESSPKTAMNRPKTYEKLYCKGETYQLSISKIRQKDTHPVTVL